MFDSITAKFSGIMRTLSGKGKISEKNVRDAVEEIKEALISYRTKTYKLNRIKAYEVFKNVSCDRIAKFAPTSLEDLKALRCLDEAQITLYGQDIIEIVKQVLNK